MAAVVDRDDMTAAGMPVHGAAVTDGMVA